MLRRGSVAFGLEEDVLLEALSKRRGSRRFAGGGRASSGGPEPAGSRSGPAAPGGRIPSAEAAGVTGSGVDPEAAPEIIDPIEKELAARCLTEEGAIAEVVANGGATSFHSKTLQALLRSWLQMARAPLPDEIRALTDMEPLARAILAEHGVEEGRTDEMSRRGARELIQRLDERRLRASIHELDLAIRQAERTHDEGSLDRLVAERRDLASKLHGSSHPAVS